MNKSRYDGFFEYQGEKVNYWINSEFHMPIKDRFDEIKSAQRFINFYDEDDIHLGTYPYYGSYQKITNISRFDAEKIFLKMINNEEC